MWVCFNLAFSICFPQQNFIFLLFSCFQFAHRDCIQRWCNEKGNTTCEICLQVCIWVLSSKFFFFFFLMFCFFRYRNSVFLKIPFVLNEFFLFLYCNSNSNWVCLFKDWVVKISLHHHPLILVLEFGCLKFVVCLTFLYV